MCVPRIFENMFSRFLFLKNIMEFWNCATSKPRIFIETSKLWIFETLIFIPQLGLPIRGSDYTPKQSVACSGASRAWVPRRNRFPGSGRVPRASRAWFPAPKSKVKNCLWHSQLSKNCLWRSVLSNNSKSQSHKVEKSQSPKVKHSQSPEVQKSKSPKVQKSQSPKVPKSESRTVQKSESPKVPKSSKT